MSNKELGRFIGGSLAILVIAFGISFVLDGLVKPPELMILDATTYWWERLSSGNNYCYDVLGQVICLHEPEHKLEVMAPYPFYVRGEGEMFRSRPIQVRGETWYIVDDESESHWYYQVGYFWNETKSYLRNLITTTTIMVKNGPTGESVKTTCAIFNQRRPILCWE